MLKSLTGRRELARGSGGRLLAADGHDRVFRDRRRRSVGGGSRHDNGGGERGLGGFVKTPKFDYQQFRINT